MQQETIHLTSEVQNQQGQEQKNEQIERELSDAELAHITGAAGIPLLHQYNTGVPFNRYVERFGH